MTLEKWVRETRVKRVAVMLGVTKVAVYSWLKYKQMPNAETMKKIVQVSKAKVTYEEIIEDFLANKNAGVKNVKRR